MKTTQAVEALAHETMMMLPVDETKAVDKEQEITLKKSVPSDSDKVPKVLGKRKSSEMMAQVEQATNAIQPMKKPRAETYIVPPSAGQQQLGEDTQHDTENGKQRYDWEEMFESSRRTKLEAKKFLADSMEKLRKFREKRKQEEEEKMKKKKPKKAPARQTDASFKRRDGLLKEAAKQSKQRAARLKKTDEVLKKSAELQKESEERRKKYEAKRKEQEMKWKERQEMERVRASEREVYWRAKREAQMTEHRQRMHEMEENIKYHRELCKKRMAEAKASEERSRVIENKLRDFHSAIAAACEGGDIE
ncbi:expressed unknown protein [Seminavis robusta]|uniref:Uncharacterized protein n=1 Tax=Seminavis robusta TaxID=568900 RepID=A0A9N8H768_9STRA|nr:expressed unknown protein [Seminavis robusta]|eukprot:Sro120_g058590.1 n/a (306) ;mRNA; f:79692-80609